MIDLTTLNQRYKKLHPMERMEQLFKDFDAAKVLVTSSFGVTAPMVLHLVQQAKPQHPIHFIDTAYHFEETIAYKQRLAELFGLRVVDVKPNEHKNNYSQQRKLWRTNPDMCCKINKVQPLQRIKGNYDIWVSGLMKSQSDHRENLDIFQQKGNIIKFHPIIDMDEAEAFLYMHVYQIPSHPLFEQGYESIGCRHCTRQGACRLGRWANLGKTECGLHL